MEVKIIFVIVATVASLEVFSAATTKPPWCQDSSNCVNPYPGAVFLHQPNKTRSTSNYQQYAIQIPGTELKTRTFYKLALKRFPKGVITWTQQGKGSFSYVQVDNYPENMSKYKPGGNFHQDAMWEFVPVLHQGQETGWYGLRNGAVSKAYMTWSPKDHVDDSKHALHMILEKNYPGDRQEGDFFLKPVKVEDEGRVYYQLKLKNIPSGVVTWSQKGYENEGSHYIEVDNHTDEKHMTNYKEGGKWYDDTLFTVTSPEIETQAEEEIGHLEH